MKKIFLLLIPIAFSSCASILNGKMQKVDVNTHSSESVVYVNGIKKGNGKTVQTKLPRNKTVQQIRIETDGYKDQHIIHYQNQKSPLHIVSWVPFGLLVYPPFLDMGPKSFNYKKEVAVKEKLIPIIERKDDDKYVFLKNTAFDLDESDLKVKKIRHSQLKRNKDKFKDVTSNTEEIKFDNSIFTNSLNNILYKYSYTDTTNTIFKNKNNTLYISAKISSMQLNHVYQKAARAYQDFLKAEVNIEWDVQDIYGQSKYKEVVKGKSGEFSTDYSEENVLIDAVDDAITASFLKFFNKNQVRGFMTKESFEEIKLERLLIQKGIEPKSVDDAVKASVTIKTDIGHGSGGIIGKDGYVMTNFHVVSNAKEIEVITNSGEKLKASIVRKNENLDIAILKVESAFTHTFILNNNSFSMGDDIFVVGTPNSIELGQTVSKGIISGIRDEKESNNRFIQTDASINPGNSGGPMITKQGKLLGVVNAKISGFGVEGLGFAIPIDLIIDKLSISQGN